MTSDNTDSNTDPQTERTVRTERTEQNWQNEQSSSAAHLLGAADIRRIAADAGITPTKKFGQNFVIDPGTVRRIVNERDRKSVV